MIHASTSTRAWSVCWKHYTSVLSLHRTQSARPCSPPDAHAVSYLTPPLPALPNQRTLTRIPLLCAHAPAHLAVRGRGARGRARRRWRAHFERRHPGSKVCGRPPGRSRRLQRRRAIDANRGRGRRRVPKRACPRLALRSCTPGRRDRRMLALAVYPTGAVRRAVERAPPEPDPRAFEHGALVSRLWAEHAADPNILANRRRIR